MSAYDEPDWEADEINADLYAAAIEDAFDEDDDASTDWDEAIERFNCDWA